jgi:hypothetical protein
MRLPVRIVLAPLGVYLALSVELGLDIRISGSLLAMLILYVLNTKFALENKVIAK